MPSYMPSVHVHNFHVPLPSDIYQQIKIEAKKNNKTATELVRLAIRSWLKQRKKATLFKAISEYASQNATSSFDLDESLEKEAVEYLVNSEDV